MNFRSLNLAAKCLGMCKHETISWLHLNIGKGIDPESK